MSVFDGINGSTIIDSSYNSSAEPTIHALKMLSELTAKRRFALLGDMRELGKETEGEHVRMMTTAIHQVDKLFLVGPLMKQYAVPWLIKHNFHYEWFANALEAGKALTKQLTSGDVILVKGSQNSIFLEIAVEKLLANKSDVDKLCRREKYWDKIRG
jgi:UDP-N-acetylmuramoyl-tripeptide--D-alanyl-D-alanine ligase